jgi:phospholipid/cholesterol/gamma-HCH transport system substrate-binding protein
MYASRTTQFIVGIFALLGIAALGVLSISLGKISVFPAPGYTLYASFDNISGLKTGDQVQLDGVQIGKVVHIGLKDMRARIALRVDEGIDIDAEAIAAIKTSGIIGDKYVSIGLGSGRTLRNGDTIIHTQDAFVLEDAIGQLINNAGSGGSKDKSDASDKDKSGASDKDQTPAKTGK